MTQEQKAKAYDNIIEKANKMHHENCEACQMCIEELIPELAESEDEKINREITEFLVDFNNGEYERPNENTIDSWLSWLEKQGEQKPTDKVEPKFHEGEWLCENEPNNYARFIQILEIVNVQGKDRYRISRDIHKGEDVVECRFIENNYHSFNIQDAKDGDVLHCWIDGDEFVLIYKGIKDGYITTYGHLYQKLKSFGEEPTSMFCRTIQGHFTPATKEQHDLLFQKMREAGYEWDAEKKELKKIEQMLAQKTEPFEAEHGKYYYCIKDYFCGGKKQASKGDVVQALRGLPIMGLKDASEYFLPVNLIKCNPSWSEEDENRFNNLIFLVECSNENEPTKKGFINFINWLKSLRPQSHWKPSKEQIENLAKEYRNSLPFVGDYDSYGNALECSYKEGLIAMSKKYEENN